MTLSNVELVRALYSNWERGDYGSSEWAHPEIEWAIADGPDPGTWRGVAAMAEGFRSSMGVWKDVRAEVEEYRELDSERVLALESRGARGKASGLELEKHALSGSRALPPARWEGRAPRFLLGPRTRAR